MTQRTICLLFAVALSVLLSAVCSAQELLVAPEIAQGIYQPGQTIRWKVQVKEADVSEAAFTLKKGFNAWNQALVKGHPAPVK